MPDSSHKRDAFLEYCFQEDGVYVIHHGPAHGGSPLTLDEIQMQLMEKGFLNLSEETVLSVYRERERKIKVADEVPEEKRTDATLEICLSTEEMEAHATYEPPFGGKEISEEEFLQKLKEAGVTFGIMEEKIKQILSEKRKVQDIVVAQGKKPEDGKAAYIEYLVDFGQKNLRPKELEDGKVDYREVATVFYVEANQPLARKIPPTEGKDGQTVTGKIVKAKPGRDIALPAGKGTRASENDPHLIIAAEPGYPSLTGKKICILPLYKVEKDVDFSTGNIYFLGSVVIPGNVKPGFKVVARGDIEIHGRVEEGYLEAEGNILVKGGIIGRGCTTVKAGGNLRAKFIEQARIEASGEVKVGEEIFHSEVLSGDSVIMEGRHGKITGGKIMATHRITAKVFGNQLATETELFVGLNPKVSVEKKRLEENIEKTEAALKHTEVTIRGYQMKTRALPSEQTEEGRTLLRLFRTKQQLQARLKSYVEKLQQLKEEVEEDKKARVECTGTCFPNVSVQILDQRYTVIDDLQRPLFYLDEEGKITVTSSSSKKGR